MGNILGEVFSDYVRQQVNRRQEVLGKKSLSRDDLNVINTKTPFLRLISSVNLDLAEEVTGFVLPSPSPPPTGQADEYDLSDPYDVISSTSDLILNLDVVPTDVAGQPIIQNNELVIPNEILNSDLSEPVVEGSTPGPADEYGRTLDDGGPNIVVTRSNTKERTVLQNLIDLGISEDTIFGDKLAKRLILHGGTSNTTGINSGLNTETGAYGWGGIDERGYVPMPGITSADVKYYNNGALSESTINIKCFSRKQFALIDALYLRPGYTLLLEFGHTTYIDNASGTQKQKEEFLTPAAEALLEATTDQYGIYRLIENERSSTSGNYDAVYGKISKFNWSFNKDGSYDCTVTLIGLGSVIETLKLNNGPLINGDDYLSEVYSDFLRENEATLEEDENPPGFFESIFSDNETPERVAIGIQNPTLLHMYMYLIENSTPISSTTSTATVDEGQAAGEAALNVATVGISGAVTSLYRLFTGGTGPVDFVEETTFDGGKRSATSDFTIYSVQPYGYRNVGSLVIPNSVLYIGNTVGQEGDLDGTQSYVKLGCLINIIQTRLLIYDNNNVPFSRFDINTGDVGQSFLNDENYMLHIPGRLSGNPLVCLIPYSNLLDVNGFPDLYKTTLNDAVVQMNTGFEVDGEPFVGRIANILVNTKHVAKVLNNTVNADGDIPLLDFLQNLLSDINNALGSINNFKVEINDEGLVKIVDRVPPQYRSLSQRLNGSTPTTINAFGVKPGSEGSFVREVDLSSELSPDFASMIAIGAQVNGNQPGENATSFSNYNRGLKDRIIKDKLLTINGVNYSSPENLIFLRSDMVIFLDSVYEQLQFNPETITTFESKNKTYTAHLLGELVNQNTMNSPSFLPFNLKLTMDGISGIKLFQKFKVSDNILPPNYKQDSIDILVREVNHTISPNGWITDIGTLPAPVTPPSSKPSPLPSIKSLPEKADALSGNLLALSDAITSTSLTQINTRNVGSSNYGGATGFLAATNANAVVPIFPRGIPDPEKVIDNTFAKTVSWLPYNKNWCRDNNQYPVITSIMQSNRALNAKIHTGADVAVSLSETAQLIAPIGGVVTVASQGNEGFGPNYVQIAADPKFVYNGKEYYTIVFMGHMSRVAPGIDGKRVNAGDYIGDQGTEGTSTNPHLHIEIRIYPNQGDPLRNPGYEEYSLDAFAWLDSLPIPNNATLKGTGSSFNA
tara:strand:- start:1219 stop:4788 length:3570 start_codon:yes stop_codon:yes gene_type:complete